MGRDADRQLFALAAKRDSVFVLADALEVGLRPRQCEYRIATGRWSVVFRGVYHAPGIELTWRADSGLRALQAIRASRRIGRHSRCGRCRANDATFPSS